MVKKILLVGRGSISYKHETAIKQISKNIIIDRVSSRSFNSSFCDKKNFDLIIICSPSSLHLKHLKICEKNFKNIRILIEKPLFNKFHILKRNFKNKYFVGYNLRFHPIIKYLKKFIQKKEIYSVYITSYSYLPDWRKKDYKISVTAQKKLGGGILLELSHELDILNWLFNKIFIKHVYNKKISNLEINTDDFLNISGNIKKNFFFNLNANFYSKIKNRSLKIDAKMFSLEADLIKNSVKISYIKKKSIKKFFRFKMINSYREQILEIIQNKKKNICTFEQGQKIMKIIKKIKQQ